jgi:ribonucleotide reductase alpha subunit
MYIFDDYDVTTELRKQVQKDEKDAELYNQQEALGSKERGEVLADFCKSIESLEDMYAHGCINDGVYDPKVHGRLFHEIPQHNYAKATPDNDILPPLPWDECIPSTKAKYLIPQANTTPSNKRTSHILIKKDNPLLNEVLLYREQYVQAMGGPLNYERKVSKYAFIYDKLGRVVAMHSILAYDYYQFVMHQRQAIEKLVQHIHNKAYEFMTYYNSSHQAITAKFDYSLRTPITKRYLELPHEALVRCAISSVIGQIYDTRKDLLEYVPGSKTPYIAYERISPLSWKYLMKKVSKLASVLLNDFITLPTPTRRNMGTRNNQGTSCFLLYNFADSILGIYDTLKLKEQFSRGGGGTAVYMGGLRCDGAIIKKCNGSCTGTVPITRLHSVSTQYVNQANNRSGANADYYPWHHADFPQIILHKSIKQKGLDEKSDAREIFYAVTLDKLFMDRWKQNAMVSLFCPTDSQALLMCISYDDFKNMYEGLEKLGRAVMRVSARSYLLNIAEVALNGDPYCMAIDHANLLSMQVQRNKGGNIFNHTDLKTTDPVAAALYKKYGRPMKIYSSNLCTEVVQPTAPALASGKVPEITSVCNLATVNTQKSCLSQSDLPHHVKDKLAGFLLVWGLIRDEIEYLCHKEFADIKETDLCHKLINHMESTTVALLNGKLALVDSSVSDLAWTELLYSCLLALDIGGYPDLAKPDKDTNPLYNVDLSQKAHGRYRIFAVIQFLALFHQVVVKYMQFELDDGTNSSDSSKCGNPIRQEENIVDHSKLFMSGWVACLFADSFLGYTFNLPEQVHWYQREFRSVIIGLSSVADTRMKCEISYWDIEDSLHLERNLMESVQCGCHMASLFTRIFVHGKAYNRFIEGAMHKGLFHHDLFGFYFGSGTNRDRFKDLALSDRAVLYPQFWKTDIQEGVPLPRGYTSHTPINDMKIESGRWNWSKMCPIICLYGDANSTKTGNMPTVSSSVVVGGTASFKPYSGMYTINKGKDGSTIETCWSAIEYLKKRGLWTSDLRAHIAKYQGSVVDHPSLTDRDRRILSTAFEIEPEILVLHDVVRLAFTDQSHSSNRYLTKKYCTSDYVCHLWAYGYDHGLVTLSYYISTDTVVLSGNNSSLASGVNNPLSQSNYSTTTTPQKGDGNGGSKAISATLQGSLLPTSPSSTKSSLHSLPTARKLNVDTVHVKQLPAFKDSDSSDEEGDPNKNNTEDGSSSKSSPEDSTASLVHKVLGHSNLFVL